MLTDEGPRGGRARAIVIAVCMAVLVVLATTVAIWISRGTEDPASSTVDARWLVQPGAIADLAVGMEVTDAVEAGYVVRHTGDDCGRAWDPSPSFIRSGGSVFVGDGGLIDQASVAEPKQSPSTESSRYETAEGAHVAMTVAELRVLYGDRLHQRVYYPAGGPTVGFVLFGQKGALTFEIHKGLRDGSPTVESTDTIDDMVITAGRDLATYREPIYGC